MLVHMVFLTRCCEKIINKKHKKSNGGNFYEANHFYHCQFDSYNATTGWNHKYFDNNKRLDMLKAGWIASSGDDELKDVIDGKAICTNLEKGENNVLVSVYENGNAEFTFY